MAKTSERIQRLSEQGNLEDIIPLIVTLKGSNTNKSSTR